VRNVLPPGATLNMPPFLDSHSRQFSHNQVLQTRSIARARIHVEHVIQRAKQYNILDCISSHHRSIASVIFQPCFALVNLQKSVVSWSNKPHELDSEPTCEIVHNTSDTSAFSIKTTELDFNMTCDCVYFKCSLFINDLFQ